MIDLIAIPVLVYVGLALYAFLLADRHIFLPQPCSYADAPDLIRLQTEDGLRLAARYRPNPDARYTILYSHGNAEDLGNIEPQLDSLCRMGFAVLAYDYRGYGLSEGKPSTQGVCLDIEAAYRYAREVLGISPEDLLIYGRSVGGGPSCHLASHASVGGLILQSTFTSTFRVITRIRILPFDRLDNLALLQRITCPVLIMHGTTDRVIPFRHSEELFREASEPKRRLWVAGVGHNRFPGEAMEDYKAAITDFAKVVQDQATQPR